MNRVQVNMTLNEADRVITRDLNDKIWAMRNTIVKHPKLKVVTAKIEKMQKKRDEIKTELEKEYVKPHETALGTHRISVTVVKRNLNFAITSDELIDARKSVIGFLERAGEILKKKGKK